MPLAPAIKSTELLARTEFAPENLDDNGNLLPTAISTTDLKSRGFSVDRTEILVLSRLQARLEEQQDRKPDLRKAAFVAEFEHSFIENLIHPKDREKAFLVKPEPIKGNAAHSCIYSAIDRGRSGLRGLRALLMPEMQKALVDFQTFAKQMDDRRKNEPRRTSATRRALHFASFFAKQK